MKLSTKGRYAVTAMMDLAIHDKSGPVTLADISVCQGISLSYLEQLFAKLRKSGLVEGVRGPGGGYRLARPADQIPNHNWRLRLLPRCGHIREPQERFARPVM